MTDPWADVRTDSNHGNAWLHGHTDDADGFVGDTVVVAEEDVETLLERLLTDADALLAVAGAQLAEARQEFSDDPNDECLSWDQWLSWYRPTLAALPEHLKGDTNERSRKA